MIARNIWLERLVRELGDNRMASTGIRRACVILNGEAFAEGCCGSD